MLVEGLRGLRYKRGYRESVGLSGCLWRLVWGVCWEMEECVGAGTVRDSGVCVRMCMQKQGR